VAHVTFIAEDPDPRIKVVESEILIDIADRMVYSIKDSTYFPYKDPTLLPKEKRRVSRRASEYTLCHGEDTTWIILDTSLPNHLTGELIIENADGGIREIKSRKYTTKILSRIRVKNMDLSEKLLSAKSACTKSRTPRNLLFGY
jgi:hypothetical protein